MAFDTGVLDALKAKIWGEVLVPGDAGYDAGIATSSMQAAPKKPALVIRARGTMDVQEAVKFASTHQLALSVKGGGHSAAHWGLVEGGLCIDLSLMRGCVVDPVNKTATAEGGCLLGDIDRETAVHNLLVPLGHAPVTGMGLALGGGIGVATRLYGATSDHIIGVTLVKADGSVVVVDEKSDPELLWALKGAGASLGVATRITFRLHQLDDKVYAGSMIWPDDAKHDTFKTIARWMMDVARHEPGYSNNVVRAFHPDLGPILVAMVMHVGDKSREAKEAFLKPLRDLKPAVDSVGQDRYLDMQFTLMAPISHMPPNYQYWTSGQLTASGVTDAFLDAFVAKWDAINPSEFPASMWLFDMWGGALLNGSGPTPFSLGYLDPKLHDQSRQLSRKIKAELSGYGDSDVYANLTNDASESGLAARVGGADNLKRLQAIKARVDPGNVFRSHTLQGLMTAA